MINHFLANVVGTRTPSNWPWPSFTPRNRQGDELLWYNAIVGTGLSTEHHFRRCLFLDSVVAASPMAGRRKAVDPRITYTAADVRQRLTPYGWFINSSEGAGTASPVFTGTCPAYLSTTVTVTSSNTVGVVTAAGASYAVTLTFSDGRSSPIDIVGDGSATITIEGTGVVIGQWWTVARWEAENDIGRALDVVSKLRTPTWLSPELLNYFHSFTKDQDKLVSVICGFAE